MSYTENGPKQAFENIRTNILIQASSKALDILGINPLSFTFNMKEFGIDLFWIFTKFKMSAYEEYLPDSGLINAYKDIVKANSEVYNIPKESLENLVEGDLYPFLNTHWFFIETK